MPSTQPEREPSNEEAGRHDHLCVRGIFPTDVDRDLLRPPQVRQCNTQIEGRRPGEVLVNVQPTTKIDHPTTRAASTAITGLYVEHQTTLTPSDRNQMETLQVNEQITPITTTKPHRAAAGRVRHRPRSFATAGVEVRSPSRTSTSTHNPQPTPTHRRSTLKSQINETKKYTTLYQPAQ